MLNRSELAKNLLKLNLSRCKTTVDKSLVPRLNENDLKESFIKGSGPGGQAINKTVNCVRLIHKPTGITVKVQESRDLQQNRKIARERLIKHLDNHYNGENSVENQKKELAEEKSKKKVLKQKKLSEMKTRWRETIYEYQKIK